MKDYNAKRIQPLVVNGRKSLASKVIDWDGKLFDWLTEKLETASSDLRRRAYPLLETFKLFFTQVLSADGSCQEVVSAHCLASGGGLKNRVSSNTSA